MYKTKEAQFLNSKLLAKTAAFCGVLAFAALFIHAENTSQITNLSETEILRKSRISYKAEGGFTAVNSFGVVIQCVNGRVSVLKTLHDPTLPQKQPIRQTAQMEPEAYLNLWKSLDRTAFLQMQSCPLPKREIDDEFTFHFEAEAGGKQNSCQVYGIKRPEASRFFAIRRLIDDFAGMNSLWHTHQTLAKSTQNQIQP